MKRRKSKSFTIAWLSFFFSVLFTGLGVIEEVSWGGNTFKFRQPDAALILALLTPSFGLYGFRRWTDSRYLGRDANGGTPKSSPSSDTP